MPKKKLYTRREFEKARLIWAKKMFQDKKLQNLALNTFIKADQHNWIHQTNWLGEPILQLPQDMFALQEIIFRTKPEYIIEIGVAWGGSLLFYSTIMEVISGQKVIGVDIFLPPDLKKRLASHGKISQKITLIKGSSTEIATIKKIKAITKNSKKTLIVLDSHHTHDHVLQELRLYSPLIGKGYYLVCGDTIIEDFPPQKHRPRPWGPGNNPHTALMQFLKENKAFKIDKNIRNKLLFSCHANGYLIRHED
jgi:cephalosporin hydroxylase